MKEITECYASAGARYVLIRDSKAGNERNIAATHCTGKWIAFLDDDDEWYPEKTARQMGSVHDGASIICSPYDLEEDGKMSEFVLDEEKLKDPAAILGENIVGCTSMQIVSKEAFDRIRGYDPRFRANQEWDLWIRLGEQGSICAVQFPAGIKHVGKNTISTDPGRRMKGWRSLFIHHYREYIRNPGQLARMLWFVCMDCVRFRRPASATLVFSAYCAVSLLSKILGKTGRRSIRDLTVFFCEIPAHSWAVRDPEWMSGAQ